MGLVGKTGPSILLNLWILKPSSAFIQNNTLCPFENVVMNQNPNHEEPPYLLS
jgi:hypothetical protein